MYMFSFDAVDKPVIDIQTRIESECRQGNVSGQLNFRVKLAMRSKFKQWMNEVQFRAMQCYGVDVEYSLIKHDDWCCIYWMKTDVRDKMAKTYDGFV